MRPGTATLGVAWCQGAVALVLGLGVVPRVARGGGLVAGLAGLFAVAAGLTAVGGVRIFARGWAARGLALVIAGGTLASLPFVLASVAVLAWWWQGGRSSFATPGFLLGTLAVLGLPVAWTVGATWWCVSRRARLDSTAEPSAIRRRTAGAWLAASGAGLVAVAVASTWARFGVVGRVDELCHAAVGHLARPAVLDAGAAAVPALERAADGGVPPELGALAARGLEEWLVRGQMVFGLHEIVVIRGSGHAQLTAMRALARIGPDGQRALLNRIVAKAPWWDEGLFYLGDVAHDGGLATDLELSPQHITTLVALADSLETQGPGGGTLVSTFPMPAARVLVWAPGLTGRLRDLVRGYPGSAMASAAADCTRDLVRRHPNRVAGLIEALDAGDLTLALFVKQVVAGLGPDATEAIPHLVAALDSEYWGARAAALHGLARIGPAAAAHRERVAALLDDPHPSVRAEARRAAKALNASDR